jgi:hypothetical protein
MSKNLSVKSLRFLFLTAVVFVSVSAVSHVGVANAAVVTWQGDESANWGTGGNWSSGSVPSTGDIATKKAPVFSVV